MILFSVPTEYQFAVQVRSGTKTCQSVKVNRHGFKIPFSFLSLNCKVQIIFTHLFFIECPLGFHSFNCHVACKFPSFGDDCQYLCNCNESSCDHRFGCNMFNGK